MSQRTATQTGPQSQTAVAPIGGVMQRKCTSCGQHSVAGGVCSDCEKETGLLQRRASSSEATSEVPPIVHEVLRSPGQPLDPATLAFMEPRFGHDFSEVRVHTDSTATKSARAVNALAYTVGQDIVFGEGQYPSRSSGGLGVLAHELTHTIQQAQGMSGLQTSLRVGKSDDAYEREADVQAHRVLTERGASVAPAQVSASEPVVRRLGDLTRVPAGFACGTANAAPPATVAQVLFGNSATNLTGLDRVRVDNFIVNWRAAGGNVPVRVVGYASTSGTDEMNWQLSCERAQNIAAELGNPAAGIPGIPAALITTVAQGETTEFGAEADNRRATILANFPQQPTPRPAAPAATGVVFSESRSPAEQFTGYDNSAAPHWLVVPVGGARVAETAIAPAGAAPTFVSLDTSIATVVATAGGISVTGIAAGTTQIEAREGANVLATLRISVKNRRDITAAFHYVCDSAVPVPHCTTGTTADTPGLLVAINNVWELQANVRFSNAGSTNVTAPGDLGAAVDWTSPGGGEWNTVTALGLGANYNVFRVWRYVQDGVWPNDAANLGVNTLVGDHPCADGLGLAHETGHFLGRDHPEGFIMTPCGGRVDRRVPKAMADLVNP